MEGIKFTSEVITPEDKYRGGASARPKWEGTFKVTESLKNEKITYLIEEPGRNSTITLVLEPVEEGTKLTYAASYEIAMGNFWQVHRKIVQGNRSKGNSRNR